MKSHGNALTSAQICVANCYADDNKGDSGIIIATALGLKHAYRTRYGGDLEVKLLSLFSREDINCHQPHRYARQFVAEVVQASVPQRYVETRDLFRMFQKAIYFPALFLGAWIRVILFTLCGRRWKNILTPELQVIAASIATVSKGGSILYCDRSLRGHFLFSRMLFPLIYSQWLGTPAIIFGQSIGPFETVVSRQIARRVLDGCSAIYLREHFSYDHLKALGVNKPLVRVIPDTAFLLANYFQPSSKVPCAGGQGRRILGVTVTRVSFIESVQREFEEKIARIIAEFLSEFDWDVRFLPQVTGPDEFQDDRIVQNRILSGMDSKYLSRVVSVTQNLAPPDLLIEYGRLTLLFAMRLHSSIFAATQGTVAVVLEYQQRKAKGTFAQLNMEDAVFDWQEPEENILGGLRSAVSELTARKRRLRESVKQFANELEGICADIISLSVDG